ncbi:hypothetical protein [Denitromonas halophila]|uniref:Dicarboxylate transport domain-containing protein n=1 Tax=Denitromonas halophila TaxID=1629404 RepID=A0A557QJG7_9RHOO|nr:hypothetical protein [Denitromonas halophila]TVO53051.1 hypothetical protein FHP91_14685 [Denitromonas halophila]
MSGAAWAGLQLDIHQIDHPSFSARGVSLLLDGSAGRIRLDQFAAAGRQWRAVYLDCRRLQLDEGRIQCADARVGGVPELAGARLNLDFSTKSRSGRLTAQFADDARLTATLAAHGALDLKFSHLPVALLARVWPAAAPWHPVGALSGRASFDGRRATVSATLESAGFSDASGSHAAEALAGDVRLSAVRQGDAWRWDMRAAWTAGGVFWDPVFVPSGVSLLAEGQVSGQEVTLFSSRLDAPGVGDITAKGRLDMADRKIIEAEVSVRRADLAVAVPQFVLPVVAPAQTERWQVAGWLDLDVRWLDGELHGVEVGLDQVGFAYLGQRFRVGPLSGHLPWHRDTPAQGHLQVDGLHWQKLDFAPFLLDMSVEQGRIKVDPARLPVLDGAIIIDRLTVAKTEDGWQGAGGFFMEPVSMRALTTALDLPEMVGTLSASIPGLIVTPRRAALDGALVIALFDGYVQATGLEVIEPFGLLPRLRADVVAEHLDMAQLTETFSFGAVSGFIDLALKDLQMAAWKPVRFDASVRSTPGDYRRRISQRAVEHITALGGPSASAAIQRSFLQFFNDFGYGEIGVGCRLASGVCQMEGLEGPGADASPFTIVRGGGIPALNVIGYNRRVNWDELIARVKAAIASDAAPIIK